MTSSNGNIFRVTGPLCGNSPVTGEFPAQRPVTWSFDVFFDLSLNKPLCKQSWGWWFETPLRSLWRHCNAMEQSTYEELRVRYRVSFVSSKYDFCSTSVVSVLHGISCLIRITIFKLRSETTKIKNRIIHTFYAVNIWPGILKSGLWTLPLLKNPQNSEIIQSLVWMQSGN